MPVLVTWFCFSQRSKDFVQTHLCWTWVVLERHPYLSFTQARHLKGSCTFSPCKSSFWNCHHFLMQKSKLPDQLPLPINIWDDSLDTAVGGGGSVGHHLALAGDVIVAGERGVVGHQPVLGGHVLWGVGAVWLGVVTLQHWFIAHLFSHDINRILYLGWNHGSLEVGRLIFRQCRFSPEVWSNYLQPHYKQFCFRVKD